MRLRVSDLDAWRGFVEPERPEFETSLDDFLGYLRRETAPNEKMQAGSAFHSVLEHAQEGEIAWTEQDGFRFEFADDLPPVSLTVIREEDIERTYETPSGPVLLRGKVDGREGIEVTDYKLTFGQFDAERYAASMQWRAYLDMTGAKRFRYLVFCGKLSDTPDGLRVWIYDVHELVFWAYPEIGADVRRCVSDLAAFVAVHVPTLAAA